MPELFNLRPLSLKHPQMGVMGLLVVSSVFGLNLWCTA